MSQISLIATDFDGTLLRANADNAPEPYVQFRLQLRDLRGAGAHWAIVTGRHRAARSYICGELQMRGLVADFLVMEDARIYRRRGRFYVPFLGWNWLLTWRRRAQLHKHRQRVSCLVRETEIQYPGATNLAHQHLIDFWFEFGFEDHALACEERLRAEYGDSPDFFVFRWGTEVCLAPTAGVKGEALQRMSRHLGIPASSVLAIGDGQNDISMLDGRTAGMPACVANASREVIDTVRQAGGYIARAEVMAGVVEALEHYGHQAAMPRS